MDFDAYHRWYYDNEIWMKTAWLGVPALKAVQDLWSYQEIISDLRPGLIVEFGVRSGGSTLYFASILDQLGEGQVLGVDINLEPVHDRVRSHPRVTLIESSSIEPNVCDTILAMRDGYLFVVLDSDHRASHVLAELSMLTPIMQSGDYVIVEDSNINGHPVQAGWGRGPMEAMDEFFAANPNTFRRDVERESKFGWTFAPRGFLIRN